MDDDLGTPAALAAIHEAVREGNTALARGDHVAAAPRSVGARDARRARPGPAGPAVGHRRRRRSRSRPHRRAGRASRSSSGRRPAPARTSPRPTRSATSSPPRASPSRTPRGPHLVTDGADPLMAGNSQRRGARAGRQEDGDASGPAARTAARWPAAGPTPPAEGAGAPGAAASRGSGQAAASAPTAAAGDRRGGATTRTPGDCCSAATRWSRRSRAEIPATALYVVTGHDRRRADRRGHAAGRRPRAAAAGGAGPSSTGCPAGRCTRASACRCRRTSTRTPTTCWTPPATAAGRR